MINMIEDKALIYTNKQLAELVKDAERFNEVQLDIETTGLHFMEDKILTIQLGFNGYQYMILTDEFPESELGPDQLMDLNRLTANTKITIIGHNLIFDCSFLQHQIGLQFNSLYDTMLAEIVFMGFRSEPTRKISMSLDACLKRHGIVSLSKEFQTAWIGFNPLVDHLTFDLLDYGLDDVTYLEELANSQLSKMTDNDKKILKLEMKVLVATVTMRLNGIGFNEDKWRALAKDSQIEFDAVEHTLNFLSKGKVENWNSTQQVKEYFKVHQLIEIDTYANLDKIKAEYPNNGVLDSFIQLRSKSKNVSAYGESWLITKYGSRKNDKTYPTVINGRVHCDYQQIINTGRFSCSNPNLQQIPRAGGFRECFEAPEGYQLCIADYSGQEIGIAAVLSNERAWLEIIESGGSVHDLTASVVYGPDYTPMQRQICKNFNFGFLYGGGAKTLAQTINLKLIEAGITTPVTESEVQKIITKMKQAVPKLFNYLKKKGNIADERKEAFTKLGRRRNLEYEFRAYTQGMNHPIQGTGADIIKKSMVMVHEEITNYEWDVKLILQVHDELITEVADNDAGDWKIRLQEIMEDASYQVLGSDVIKAEPTLSKVWTK
jgi:DNA polymerase I-like protein with 3'-5' exonuclease and polymerase domains